MKICTPEELRERAAKIKCIISDVDGTLTDGSVIIDHKQKTYRIFNMRDGLAIGYLKKAGLKFGMITGDYSDATKAHAKKVKADYIYLDCVKKKNAIMEIIDQGGYLPEELAYIGDELIDIPALRSVGLAVAVQDAAIELNDCIHYRTKALGGRGTLRELVELVLKSKGVWQYIVKSYYED
ncbi:MAG: HAD hydrolase family protein [Bacteriovoracaceae bacterium]|nr:HAD hydrolase family protein [Bacteriovoracaceae bacterium]